MIWIILVTSNLLFLCVACQFCVLHASVLHASFCLTFHRWIKISTFIDSSWSDCFRTLKFLLSALKTIHHDSSYTWILCFNSRNTVNSIRFPLCLFYLVLVCAYLIALFFFFSKASLHFWRCISVATHTHTHTHQHLTLCFDGSQIKDIEKQTGCVEAPTGQGEQKSAGKKKQGK